MPKHNLGQDIAPCVQITFHPAPLDVKDEYLYIRSGNSIRKLTVKEAISYVESRCPG